jgi:hypothetical protein
VDILKAYNFTACRTPGASGLILQPGKKLASQFTPFPPNARRALTRNRLRLIHERLLKDCAKKQQAKPQWASPVLLE